MRVLVTGSRDWQEWLPIWETIEDVALGYWGSEVVVVHGACPSGADKFASEWCQKSIELHWNVTEEPHPADWTRYGKSAGFRRNAEMVNLGADLCLAFIRNNSKGATMTAELAQKAGIETRIYREG